MKGGEGEGILKVEGWQRTAEGRERGREQDSAEQRFDERKGGEV